MRRAMSNYLVDFAMFVLLLFEVASGFILWFVLPKGGGYMGGRGLITEATFLWSRDTWIVIHDWVAVALLVVVVLHLVLHWKWIVYTTKAFLGQQ